MSSLALEIVYCLLIAAFIGFLIGYLIGKASAVKRCGNSFTNNSYKKQGNIYHKPFILSNARPSGADELTLVDGIDNTIKTKLNSMGIFHIDQIANWSNDNAIWVDNFLELEKKPQNENWSSQAKELLKQK